VRLVVLTVTILLAWTSAARALPEKLDLSIRGQTITVSVYRPRTVARGTILMGSGDVGWVGLAVSMAEDLSSRGYAVVGINVRQYLAAFTSGKAHVAASEVSADYRAIADRLKQAQLLVRPVVLSGVSEGAALAVLAASDPKNHPWIDGVITMGLPPTAELAWRWTDAGSWITKRDSNEPSFAPSDVIARIAPVPLTMIQSKKDEYVSAADYERFRTLAGDPKQLILIDASNHRFTDRQVELHAAYDAALTWIRERVR
jgi:alpha-beta hydrolase superfamily lysophospholipase